MSTTTDPLPPDLLEHLLDTVVAAIPAAPDDTEQRRAAHRETARLALLALQPQNAFQAMLAAQAVAAHYAVMDNLKRAAQPDLAPAMAARLRANAASVARMMQATVRALQKQQAHVRCTSCRRPSPRVPPQSLSSAPARYRHASAGHARRRPHRRPRARAPLPPLPSL